MLGDEYERLSRMILIQKHSPHHHCDPGTALSGLAAGSSERFKASRGTGHSRWVERQGEATNSTAWSYSRNRVGCHGGKPYHLRGHALSLSLLVGGVSNQNDLLIEHVARVQQSILERLWCEMLTAPFRCHHCFCPSSSLHRVAV